MGFCNMGRIKGKDGIMTYEEAMGQIKDLKSYFEELIKQDEQFLDKEEASRDIESLDIALSCISRCLSLDK